LTLEAASFVVSCGAGCSIVLRSTVEAILKFGVLALTVAVACLAGCATNRAITLTAPFDAAVAKAQLADGSNSIKGSALIRQMGGGVVTCAGGPVFLMPATAMANEWATYLYGSPNGGFFDASGMGLQFQGAQEMYAAAKHTTCNAQGSFSFDRVADGEFLVFTRITWLAGQRQQGGSIMRRVKLSGAQTTEVVLSPDGI
jgi:hypothetical protein